MKTILLAILVAGLSLFAVANARAIFYQITAFEIFERFASVGSSFI